MRHYCTYFDSGFLCQGLALSRSLLAREPSSVLWVLALDTECERVLGLLREPNLRIVGLSAVEADDPELAAAKANRSRVEYYFTLSPVWPRWLLKRYPEIEQITYVDADMALFGSLDPVFQAMDEARASVLVTAHRFPSWLTAYERHGRFNVGILSWRRTPAGIACLDRWRGECLTWCYDRLEADRYADQKYLDAWPAALGNDLCVLEHAGVNYAPWNWRSCPWIVGRDGRVGVGGMPLLLFHAARFRPLLGTIWWQSGHLDYGVMPFRLRNAIYGPYARLLMEARATVRTIRPGFDFPRRSARLGRSYLQGLFLRLVAGSDWLRVGPLFFGARAGLGRYSGQVLQMLRRTRLRA